MLDDLNKLQKYLSFDIIEWICELFYNGDYNDPTLNKIYDDANQVYISIGEGHLEDNSYQDRVDQEFTGYVYITRKQKNDVLLSFGFAISDGNSSGTDVEYFHLIGGDIKETLGIIKHTEIPRYSGIPINIKPEDYISRKTLGKSEWERLYLGRWDGEQSGRTSNQMLEAPKNAIFVWCRNNTHYAKDLAKELGREDLEIKPKSWVIGKHCPWRGLGKRVLDVIIDHALDIKTKIGQNNYNAYLTYRRTYEKMSRENIKQKPMEETIMSSTQRRTVTIEIFDDDHGLPVELSLVQRYEGIVTEDDDQTTIRELLMAEDIKSVLEKHNAKRQEEVNTEVLERTGQEVKLRPVKLKDLRFEVK